MRKNIYFLLFLCFVLSLNGLAQVIPEKEPFDSLPKLVQIISTDNRIDEMLDKKVAIPKTINKLASTKTVLVDRYGRVNMPGFRLQVINSTDRSLIYATKAKLYQQFPTHNQYVIAQAPFFKLRFGNFATKAEAEKFRKILSPMFPNGVYVVPDIIESRVKLEKKTETKPKEKLKETVDNK